MPERRPDDPAVVGSPVEVELVLLDLTAAGDLRPALDLLTTSEHARCEALRTAELRRDFVVSRAFLRQLLARRLGLAPGDVPLREAFSGKPELEAVGGRGLRFSTSRSAGLALFAVAVGCEVGVDIEVVSPHGDLVALERRFLSPPEQATLSSLAGIDRTRAVVRFWARKEAFLKATGVGLWAPWPLIDTSTPAAALGGRAERLGGGHPWTIVDLDVGAAHAAAVCVEGAVGPGWRPDLRRVEERPFDP